MHSVIFFDGVCNLCNGLVQFVIERDEREHFKFASLQSKSAKTMLEGININFDELQSLVLLEHGVYYQQSTAALRIFRKLNGFWPLLYAFIIIPKPLRDLVYRWVARNRYKWYGKREQCWVPTPDLKNRFIAK